MVRALPKIRAASTTPAQACRCLAGHRCRCKTRTTIRLTCIARGAMSRGHEVEICGARWFKILEMGDSIMSNKESNTARELSALELDQVSGGCPCGTGCGEH